MGLEPLRAEAKRTLGRGPQRATGAPSEGVALLGFEFTGFRRWPLSSQSPPLPDFTGLPWIWTGLLGQTH
jgi:hypothetical protein